jgi:hypothetical protein
MKAEALRRPWGILRRLALDHRLLHALDRLRRVEDADVPPHQPVEDAASRRQMRVPLGCDGL